VKPGFVVDLLTGLDAIDAALAGRAAVHVLAWPVPYGLDAILVPALRQLAEAGDRLDTPARAQLRTAAVAHLRARAALPLAPPADWRRESTLACRCAHCQELAGFLDDPARKGWVFKAAEGLRGQSKTPSARPAATLTRQPIGVAGRTLWCAPRPRRAISAVPNNASRT
jgi:hypothetical protein